MTQKSRLTIVRKLDDIGVNKRNLISDKSTDGKTTKRASINIIRKNGDMSDCVKYGGIDDMIESIKKDNMKDSKKTHSSLFLDMYNNENIDVKLNQPIEQIYIGGKRVMDAIDGSVIRKIFKLPEELHLLPRVQFPVCKELVDRLDECKFTGNEIVAANKVLEKINKSVDTVFTGSVDECIKYIKTKDYSNVLFGVVIPISMVFAKSKDLEFYESYFVPISGLDKDNMTIYLYVNDNKKLVKYDINIIKDVVMFDICKY